jgi:molecular chaperone GrpE
VFDPNLHHGIDLTETTEATDQTILHEFQRGYLFKGKLLRPAMVRVAVNPGASGSTGEQNAEGN